MSQSVKQKDPKSYSHLQKMKIPVSPGIFALKSWRPKEWFYTSSYPETSLTMLSTKHCGTVKDERSLVPTPFEFPLVSDSLGHPHVTENDWRQNCTRQVFFTFFGNYDKCIANEARNTSFSVSFGIFLKLNAHKVGTILGLGHFKFLKEQKIDIR